MFLSDIPQQTPPSIGKAAPEWQLYKFLRMDRSRIGGNGFGFIAGYYCRGAGYRILLSVKEKGHTVFHSPSCT